MHQHCQDAVAALHTQTPFDHGAMVRMLRIDVLPSLTPVDWDAT
jgi:hypothetical protein